MKALVKTQKGKGFIEVGHDQVQFVVQSAEAGKDIDKERAKEALQRAEKELNGLDGNLSDPKYAHYLLRQQRAEARLAAADLA